MRPLLLAARSLGVAVTFLTAISAVWSAPPLALGPVEGVLLLRNGEVLAGRITQAGDHYYLSRPRGDLRLRAAEVERVATDLNDIYRAKQGQVEPGDAQAHLDLAEWCVQQKLLDEAARELGEVGRLEPDHPRRGLVERRLALAQRGDPPAAAPKKPEPGPTNDDLDRLVRGMPGRSVEVFTSTVQPLLVNNCTSSGCHNAHSPGKLRLWRLPLAGPPSRRVTQRNLHSVWQTIDFENSLESPLLTQPLAPHGTAKDAIFANRDADQYRQLAGWVQSLAPSGKTAQPSSVAQRADPLSQTMPRRGGKSRPAPRKPTPPGRTEEKPSKPGPISSELEPEPVEPEKSETNDSPSRQAREADYEPVDPFDPEIFNRRYFAD